MSGLSEHADPPPAEGIDASRISHPWPAQLQRAPDALQIVLLTGHLSSAAVYGGLFRASRAGRDWALSTAPRAHLTLQPPTAPQSAQAWASQLTTVSQALAARGELGTSLTVQCEQGVNDEALRGIPDALSAASASHSITELTVLQASSSSSSTGEGNSEHSDNGSDGSVITTFLQAAGNTFVHITALNLSTVRCPLPPPSHFPNVTTLSAYASEQNSTSIAAYIPQLTTLTISVAPRVEWAQVFTQPAPSLRQLSTDRGLDHPLLAALLDHAPGLTQLSVAGIRLTSDGHVTQQWAVQRLELATVSPGPLAFLPKSTVGRMRVVLRQGSLPLQTNEKGINETLAARLCEWCFEVATVIVSPGRGVNENKQHAALSAVLKQLVSLEAPGAVTELKDWHWPSAPLRHTLITSAPTLTHLSLTIRSTQALTDTLLSALLSLAPHVRRVSVSSLQLETADHVDTPWPWEELAVDHVSARELLKLPRPVGGGSGECVVRCGSMGLAMVNEANIGPLKAWMTHVTWAPINPDTPIQFYIGDEEDPTRTHYQFSLLHAMRFQSTSTSEPAAPDTGSAPQSAHMAQAPDPAPHSTHTGPQQGSAAHSTDTGQAQGPAPHSTHTGPEQGPAPHSTHAAPAPCPAQGSTPEVTLSLYMTMTPESIESLQGMPKLAGTVDFLHCDWSEVQADECRLLGQYVPVTYAKWRLPLLMNAMDIEKARCVLQGVSDARSGDERLRPLTVEIMSVDGSSAVKEAMNVGAEVAIVWV